MASQNLPVKDRAAVVRQRVRTDLVGLAADLHRRQLEPFDILLVVLRRTELHRQLGADIPADAALRVVRRLPGLSAWQPMDDWQRYITEADPDELIAGLESPEMEEEKRSRRAHALADWLRVRAGSLIAEEIVAAAERIAGTYTAGGV
jgi:hypothetical protein